MENTGINWQTLEHLISLPLSRYKQQVKEEIKIFIYNLRDELINEKQKNPELCEHDYIFQAISSCSYTINTKKAECVALAFDVSPFDCSELTGERYNNWESIAFDVIYQEYYEHQLFY